MQIKAMFCQHYTRFFKVMHYTTYTITYVKFVALQIDNISLKICNTLQRITFTCTFGNFPILVLITFLTKYLIILDNKTLRRLLEQQRLAGLCVLLATQAINVITCLVK